MQRRDGIYIRWIRGALEPPAKVTPRMRDVRGRAIGDPGGTLIDAHAEFD
jgi:hypothetical protein